MPNETHKLGSRWGNAKQCGTAELSSYGKNHLRMRSTNKTDKVRSQGALLSHVADWFCSIRGPSRC